MKNKIKKLKLPLSKMTENEKDYTAVLMEDVNSNIKAFWEVLSGTQDDVKELKGEMINLKDAVTDNSIEIAEFKTEAIKTNASLDSIDFKIDNINKENKEKIILLEVRTNKVERHLNLA